MDLKRITEMDLPIGAQHPVMKLTSFFTKEKSPLSVKFLTTFKKTISLGFWLFRRIFLKLSSFLSALKNTPEPSGMVRQRSTFSP